MGWHQRKPNAGLAGGTQALSQLSHGKTRMDRPILAPSPQRRNKHYCLSPWPISCTGRHKDPPLDAALRNIVSRWRSIRWSTTEVPV